MRLSDSAFVEVSARPACFQTTMSNGISNLSFQRALLMASWRMLQDMFLAVKFALVPTIRTIRTSPKLLLEPRAISRIFMANVWVPFGDGIDQNSKKVKEDLVTKYATGVVLEIGAGDLLFPFYSSQSAAAKTNLTRSNCRPRSSGSLP